MKQNGRTFAFARKAGKQGAAADARASDCALRAVIDPERISIVKAGDFKKAAAARAADEIVTLHQVKGDFDADPDVDGFAFFGAGLKTPLFDSVDGIAVFFGAQDLWSLRYRWASRRA